MLRFDHMPSDFHPVFLVLGDVKDLTALAGLLRVFSRELKPITVHERIAGAMGRSPLVLVPESDDHGRYGLRQGADGFEWRLNAWQATQIALRLEALTAPTNRSGSDIFELGVEGEIPVKVSRGEFTDDFLTPSHPLWAPG